MSEEKSFEELLETIPEEQRGAFTSALDRERTRAAKTARENTKRSLSEDSEFLKTLEPKFKEKFELEANMTAEDKLKEKATLLEAREKRIQIDENKLFARKSLLENGIDDEQCNSVLDFVVTDNVDTTKGNIDKFLGIVKPIADKLAQNKVQEHIKNYPMPNDGSNEQIPGKTKEQIEARIKEATKKHDFITVSRLTRELNDIK